jgi:hypothetical protein
MLNEAAENEAPSVRRRRRASPGGGARQTFLLLTNDLFGPPGQPEPVPRRAVARYLGLALALGGLLILRRVDAILTPQFWAEDGPIWFRQNLLFGFWQSFANFYVGFPYLLHRSIAQAARPFGITNAPLFYTVASVTIAATASAYFSLPWCRHLVRNDGLRILFCVSIVSLPGSQFLMGNVTYVHWYLGIWALLIALMPLPRSRWGLGLLLLCYGICLFSAPIAIITAPIWLVRLGRAALSRNRPEGLAVLVILGFMAAVIAITGNLGARSYGLSFNPRALSNLIVTRVLVQATIGTEQTLKLASRGSFVPFYAIAGTVVLVLLGLSVAARFGNGLVVLVCCYVIVMSMVLTLSGRGGWNQYGLELDTIFMKDNGFAWLLDDRFFFLGMAMVYLASFATIDHLRRGGLKAAVSILFLLGSVVTLVPTFVLAPAVDLRWPRYADQLSTHLATGRQRPLVIPINPPGWAIYFGFFPEREISWTEQVPMGELVSETTFSQTFVSRCPQLAQVDLLLATYRRTNTRPVTFRLFDGATDRVVAEQTIPASSVRDNLWHSFAFAPVAGAPGQRYRVALASPQSTPGDAITTYRSRMDVYPDGEALRDGQPTGGDLVFRYGCAD